MGHGNSEEDSKVRTRTAAIEWKSEILYATGWLFAGVGYFIAYRLYWAVLTTLR